MSGRRRASHCLPIDRGFFLNSLDAAAAKLRLFYLPLDYQHPGSFGDRWHGDIPHPPRGAVVAACRIVWE